jgi:hypothetical protein
MIETFFLKNSKLKKNIFYTIDIISVIYLMLGLFMKLPIQINILLTLFFFYKSKDFKGDYQTYIYYVAGGFLLLSIIWKPVLLTIIIVSLLIWQFIYDIFVLE